MQSTIKLTIENKRLKARIKELKEKLSLYEWKDIESIPRDGTEVLATDGYDVFTVKYVKSKHSIQSGYLARSSNDDFWNKGNRCRHRDERMYVTKWCHKPTPPTQEGDKEALKNLTQIGEEMGLYDLPESTQEGDKE